MKILITGAGGGIGKILLSKLIKNGYEDLFVLSRTNKEYGRNIKIVKGDLLNIASLTKALSGIDAVIHMAALTHSSDPKKYFQINAEGTKNLLTASKEKNVKRFIFVSSRAAESGGGAYAESKLIAEESVRQYAFEWIILRPAEIYGAKDDEALSKLINQIQKSFFIPVPGMGQSELAPLFADDAVDAIINSLNCPRANEIYTIAGPKTYSYNEIVELIAKSFNKKIIRIPVPTIILKTAGRFFPNHIVPDQIPRLFVKKSDDISLAQKYLNFNPKSFEEYLKNWLF